jgi:ankyrin repeat protein
MAHILLDHGANANTNVYAASSAMYDACKRNDAPMIALLEAHGGRLTPVAVAELGLVEQAARLLAGSADVPASRRLDGAGPDIAQDLLWGAIESPSPEIVACALAAVDWPRDDPRWHGILENGLYLRPDADRLRHLDAFRLVLDRCEPDVPSRLGTTILHEVAASRGGLAAGDRIAYSTLLLDRGARLDIRDDLLHSTPLGWACRWGRTEMAALLLDRGADPLERDAPAWATPLAWATKKGHDQVVSLLEQFSRQRR